MWIEILVTSVVFASITVTPYAGVWIEIVITTAKVNILSVTPYAGVWIEIADPTAIVSTWTPSLPTRECGLKYHETFKKEGDYRHSLRGSVD